MTALFASLRSVARDAGGFAPIRRGCHLGKAKLDALRVGYALPLAYGLHKYLCGVLLDLPAGLGNILTPRDGGAVAANSDSVAKSGRSNFP